MSETLAVVPPAFILLVAAFAAAFLPRTVGHGIGALATLYIVAVGLFAPQGEHAATTFLGFADVVFFNVDEFSAFMAVAIGALATAAVIYAHGSDAPKVMTGFALAYVASTVGVVFAGDWLSLIFWWELMAVTSTLLVWHHGGKAVRAGYRYAIAHGIGGSLFLFAVIWHIAAGGGLSIDGGIAVEGATALSMAGYETTAPVLLAALGIGVNCGFIGLHTWLPDTYPRPHIAASVFLSVFTTKTGAYVLYRAFPEGALVLAYLGGAMAVYGVVYALLQHDMRALLSYHIMAQVGYMTAGIGLIGYAGQADLAAAGALAHAFNNVLFKALLFMAVGVIIYRTGTEDLYKLGGLWREMPLTAAAFGVGALSITAVPGFNGFVSKGMLFDAANPAYYGTATTEPVYWLLAIGAVGTFLSFIKLGYYAFLHGPYDGPPIEDATVGQAVAMLSVGALCLVFGAYWQALVDLAPFVEPGVEFVDPYSVSHLMDPVILGTISVITFVVIKKPLSKLGHIHDMERILNPLVFYSGRAAVHGVTEAYAAIDRAAIRGTWWAYDVGGRPHDFVSRVQAHVDPAASHNPEYDEAEAPPMLRTDIGLSIMLVVAVLALVLLALTLF